MAIASNGVIAKGNHGSHLPASVKTLADLSKLPEDALEVALAEGWVRPDQVKKWWGDGNPRNRRPCAVRADGADRRDGEQRGETE